MLIIKNGNVSLDLLHPSSIVGIAIIITMIIITTTYINILANTVILKSKFTSTENSLKCHMDCRNA